MPAGVPSPPITQLNATVPKILEQVARQQFDVPQLLTAQATSNLIWHHIDQRGRSRPYQPSHSATEVDEPCRQLRTAQ